MNGIGTLLFILITKSKAPAYLGSSFAFLAPGIAIIQSQGFEYAQGAFVIVEIKADSGPINAMRIDMIAAAAITFTE